MCAILAISDTKPSLVIFLNIDNLYCVRFIFSLVYIHVTNKTCSSYITVANVGNIKTHYESVQHSDLTPSEDSDQRCDQLSQHTQCKVKPWFHMVSVVDNKDSDQTGQAAQSLSRPV